MTTATYFARCADTKFCSLNPVDEHLKDCMPVVIVDKTKLEMV